MMKNKIGEFMGDFKFPFLDLSWQYSPFKAEIMQTFLDVFENSRFIMNKSVRGLEEKFAEVHNAKHGIATSSGTAALHAALLALEVKAEEEVITTPFTFIATSNVINAIGAKPVYADIDATTFNINPEKIEEKITERTRAIMPVHLFGQSADMGPIIRIAKKHDLKIIEDAAQAHLAEYDGKSVGTLGEIGCFSLYPGKNLGAFGDGGMILTNDDETSRKIRQKINNGITPGGQKYLSVTTGLNYRMNELTAAIMLKYIHKLPEWNSKRKENAKFYDGELSQIPSITLPKINSNIKHSYHQYTIRAKNRQSLQEHLKDKGIPAMIFYPAPLHLTPAYKYLNYKKGDFPEAEMAAEEVLSLPVGPHLKKENLEEIVREIKNFTG